MPTADQQRQDRLAAALRDNLKRRKAQAREGDLAKPDPKDDD